MPIWLAVIVSMLFSMFAPVAPSDALTVAESRCATQISRKAHRLARVAFREELLCRKGELGRESGGTHACPKPQATERIGDLKEKLIAAAIKRCKSECSLSTDISCTSDQSCPPSGTSGETCGEDGTLRSFDLYKLGFPGPICGQISGPGVVSSTDVGVCVAEAVPVATRALGEAVYGTIIDGVGLGFFARRCLTSVANASRRYSRALLKHTLRCRDAIATGDRIGSVSACISGDPVSARRVAVAEAGLRNTILLRCKAEHIEVLDFCNRGGSIDTIEQAQECIVDVVEDVIDTRSIPAAREFSPWTVVEAVYPPTPVCGDNIVNQLPNGHLPVGEECDGGDDSACPGACAPPGDVFECTCLDRPRIRLFVHADGSETDAGWTGVSHNQQISEGAGFLMDVSGCDCTEFDGATCIGTSADSVCEVTGRQLPVCSWNLLDTARCDSHGNNDGIDGDIDCAICDDFSANAGASCIDHGNCQSLCYNASGVASGSCSSQTDCPSGSVCRGRCDTTPTCLKTFNGPPLPVDESGFAVCGVQEFREDVSGTKDIVTGGHEFFYRILSRVHFGEDGQRPCPVCGGFCLGGSNDLGLCNGRCENDGAECLGDGDCDEGVNCSGSTPDCPGGSCQLDRICGADLAINPELTGKSCSIETMHPRFGTLSYDCLPSVNAAITSAGLEVEYQPLTSGAVSLSPTVPCTAAGFELFDCPCPDDGGAPTKPNNCSPACNAVGPNFAVPCADGNGSGAGTRCNGGTNTGLSCDEDSDCPGGLCDANPMHCTGDPAFERFSCASNADCGTGVCGDACPGGRCLPICVPVEPGSAEGECAAGSPEYRCNGSIPRACPPASIGAGCSAVCADNGSACLSHDDCNPGVFCEGECPGLAGCEAGGDGVMGTVDDIAGAGQCEPSARACFLDTITAEGSTAGTGSGDPTNTLTVAAWCFKSSINPSVNVAAGFGGPARVQLRGTNIANFTSLP